MQTKFLFLFGLSLLASAPTMAQDAATTGTVLGIPLKPDPPPAIDGDLAEWANVPNAQQVDRKEQVVYGEGGWKGTDDLSATVRLAWRSEFLFLAADVRDDKLQQHERGGNMWMGDHLELYIDTTPDVEPERKTIGKGQFQFGFSPGNFQNTGDPLTDLKAEGTVFRPVGAAPTGILTASKRTEKGYTIEAAIPWALLGITPANGTPLAVEVGVSDTDGSESKQEKMMTLLTTPWESARNRWVPAALAPSDGKAAPQVRSIDVFPVTTLKAAAKQELQFEAPAVPAGREAVLAFNARLAFATVGGYTPALRLTLNGQTLDGSRLLNKRAAEPLLNGGQFSPAAGDLFTLPYAPDFDSPNTDQSYGLSEAKISEFALRVSDLLKVGTNTLVIENAPLPGITNDLVTSEGKLQFRVPIVPRVKAGPPTGPLPVVVPAQKHKVKYTAKQEANNDVVVQTNGESFRIASQFSTPAGAWVTGSNKSFTFERHIEKRDEAIIVHDTFTNLTGENLPIMQRHQVAMPLQKVWLSGGSPVSMIGSTSAPQNPTTFGITQKTGVGLMPLDDVFQVHVTNYSDGKALGLADNSFVLTPNAKHTADWAIVLTPQPDYFDFVNAARRLREVNFPIDGSFSFLRVDPRNVGTWSDEKLIDYVRFKNAKYTDISNSYPMYKGRYTHGTAFQMVDLSEWRTEILRRRKLIPWMKQTAYFHCFLDASDDPEKRFPDDRLLRSDGVQGDYGDAAYKLFVPTTTNLYGKAETKSIDIMLDDLKLDGVYWDELEYSAYAYHYQDFSKPGGLPWDGVSGDIDPKTMQITRLKSSVTLISQPWRIALAKRILSRGVLIGNGAPHTRTMMQLHFPRFVETGAISNCTNAQLYTPIALGDHLTERSELDAYRWMLKALDYGCVYYWYNDVTVIPTYPTLTSYMFPITPRELHNGYIIGDERIVTNRSGMFGWGDSSKHEIHVFNDQGREVTDIKAPVVARSLNRNGKTVTELRLPEDWSAAIVRVKK